MTPSDKAPLVGWMILEDYCEDMSQWDGVISFPDPTGANLAWQDPIKMIEYKAYDALAKRCAELEAENRRLDRICEQEFGRADSVGELVKRCAELEAELEKIRAGSLWREAIQLRVENAELLQLADRLTKFISDAQCECSVAERDSGHLVGCWRPDLDSLLIEFQQWREKRGEG